MTLAPDSRTDSQGAQGAQGAPGRDDGARREATAVQRVFVVGYPRSGTTWVMWLLAQHPAVAAVRQSGLFHQLRPLRGWWQRDHEFTVRAGRYDGGEGGDGGDGGAAGAPLYALRNTKDLLSLDDFHAAVRPFCDALYDRVLSQNPGARVLVEQTPENMRQAHIVQGVYPDARFLHVVRDPRAVYASMRSAAGSWSGPRGFPRHPVPIARIWTEFVQRGRALAEDPERCFQLRYEDLKEDGPGKLLEVHGWLGLETDPQACARAVEACRIDELRKRTKGPEGFYRRGQAQGWREEVSRRDLVALEHVAGAEMERWGYERTTPRRATPPGAVRRYDLAVRATDWMARTPRLAWPRALWQRAARSLEIMTHTHGAPPDGDG